MQCEKPTFNSEGTSRAMSERQVSRSFLKFSSKQPNARHHQNWALVPNDEAVFKLMCLALRNISKRWTMPIQNESAALNQFAILFDGRVPMGRT